MKELTRQLIRGVLMTRFRSEIGLKHIAQLEDWHVGVFTGQIDNFLAGFCGPDEEILQELKQLGESEVRDLVAIIEKRNQEYDNSNDPVLKSVLNDSMESVFYPGAEGMSDVDLAYRLMCTISEADFKDVIGRLSADLNRELGTRRVKTGGL